MVWCGHHTPNITAPLVLTSANVVVTTIRLTTHLIYLTLNLLATNSFVLRVTKVALWRDSELSEIYVHITQTQTHTHRQTYTHTHTHTHTHTLKVCEVFLVTDLRTLTDWLMVNGDTLSTATTQREAITHRLALSLPHCIGAALLAFFTFVVLPTLHLHHT